MKKELSPELYNYNKYPGPVFARVEDKVVSEGIVLDLVDNYKDAFDQTVFGQRFSPLMLKFDYIVGDWGNDQLRLKGFYKDEREVKSELKISRLEDYLMEYCNYGCAYFVLANPEPQELPVEPEDKPRRRRKRSNRKKKTGDGFAIRPVEKDKPAGNKAKSYSKSSKNSKPNQPAKHNKTTKSRPKKEAAKESTRSFVIRKKGE